MENNQAGKITKLICIKSTTDLRRQKQNKKFQIVNSNIDHFEKKRKRGGGGKDDLFIIRLKISLEESACNKKWFLKLHTILKEN